MWFLFTFIGYLLLAMVVIFDKYVMTAGAPGKPQVYAFYSTILLLPALLILPFGGTLLEGIDWWWAIVSGVGFGLALWTMFIALDTGEASHINPFVGAFTAIWVFGITSIFFRESLTSIQLYGLCFLIVASLLLSFEKTADLKHKAYQGFLWAILSGCFFAISHVSAKYLYGQYDFMTALVWSKATTALVGFFLLLLPSVRLFVFAKNKNKTQVKQSKKVMSIALFSKLLGLFGVVAIQYAIAIGNVTLVTALGGIQYALLFVMILILTKWFPKKFNEFFTRKELVVESLAIVLVVIGSALAIY